MLKTDNVDLIVLNRAPTHLAAEIITKGLSLAMKDYFLFLKFMLIATLEAEDYRRFAHDYYRIYQNAHSLTGEEKRNLEKKNYFFRARNKRF